MGEPARCVVLAFGKLGGEELNYSSDIDLMFLYDEEGQTRGKRITSSRQRRVLRPGRRRGGSPAVAPTPTAARPIASICGCGPKGQRGPLARSLASTLSYYDTLGRTWERQALIKVRPVAGDLDLGDSFLQAIEPFVYRKYLTLRRDQRDQGHEAADRAQDRPGRRCDTEVKTGRGGIRDIEFTIQFLQLLNGGDLPESAPAQHARWPWHALEEAGCLTDQEYRVLDDAYRFLRKTEHRLQLLFDLQTHRLPDGDDELRKLALRMGYGQRVEERGAVSLPRGIRKRGRPQPARPDDDTARAAVSDPLPNDPVAAFLHDYRDKTEPTRHILDHLLHQTFAGDDEPAEPESDLILDPDPDPETIRAVLGRYPFRDVMAAYSQPGPARAGGAVPVARGAAGTFSPASRRACCAPWPRLPTRTWRCSTWKR